MIGVSLLIDQPVLDTLRFVNIKTYLAQDEKVPPGVLPPPQLADSLDRIAQRSPAIAKKWPGQGTPSWTPNWLIWKPGRTSPATLPISCGRGWTWPNTAKTVRRLTKTKPLLSWKNA